MLDKIIAFKRSELEGKKKFLPVIKFEDSAFFKREMPSFHDALTKPGPSIIGEFKRKSPSNGMININAEIEQVARVYEETGIAAMSILTDRQFFGGADHDLQNVASFVKIPLLRKDFIVDEYQVVESKSIGASAILLIASVLSKKEVGALTELSLNLGMEVLFEIHDEKDLEKMSHKIKIIGVNNRNLKTFEVNMNHSIELFSSLPENCLKVAESGFQTYKEVTKLFTTGYNAFLIGGKFMRSKSPGETAAQFMKDLKKSLE
ncbi:MAG: indole-3-glycerol phosphate synthase TrpC [Bacteroidales bacterium]|nr:indole-3-glycerol phosphate synthase TrpC [Bacteroidales bacterium]